MNLVGGLSAEIERVGAKLTRWEDYCKDLPELASGMGPGMLLMRAALSGARRALEVGEIGPMLASIQLLKEYDDED